MTPELQKRAAAFHAWGDLRRWDARVDLVRQWLRCLEEALAPLIERDRAFHALGGDRLDFSTRLRLGSSYAALTIHRTGSWHGRDLRVAFVVVDGTVPPPEPTQTIAAQLDSPERLSNAFDAVDEALSWIRLQLDGDS